MIRTLLVTSAAIAACLAISVPAHAGGHAWQVGNDSYHLYFDDLDLQTPAGRAQALARVEKVAARLCQNSGTVSEEQACRSRVLEQAQGSFRPILLQALAERPDSAAMSLAESR